ncbi:hypothetical protein G6F56_006781 [Rhizopus delemar]|nr:hypothetical protein G6F56_006781 [Rhizopus delemar]
MLIDIYVKFVPVSEWTTASVLVRGALDSNPKSDCKTYDKFKATFKILSKSFVQQPALTRFTKLVVNYMDLESTRTAYNDEFEDATLEKMLAKAEERTRKRIKIKQTQNLNDELAAQINPSQTRAESNEAQIVAKPTIYQDAEMLHEQYQQNDNLTSGKRKRMCGGLSGILDISAASYHSQKSLFTTDEWDSMKRRYASFKQAFHNTNPNSEMNTIYRTWDAIYESLITHDSFFQARKTFYRISSGNDIDEYTFNQLQIIDYFLDVFGNKQFILNPQDTFKLTEEDYKSQICVPLFTKLFSTKKTFLIRIKTGESVPEESTKKKAEQYGTESNIIGFKVDLRLIHDYKQLEIDIASTEVALPNADHAKTRHDESKLLREAMISTEVLHHLSNDQDYIYTWTVRITGLTAVLTVLYDDENMIYVNIHQFTLYFPSCVAELEDLKDDLKMLFKFKEDIERIANKIQKALKRSEHKDVRSPDVSPERKPAPTSSVYFTSPRNEAHRSVLPPNCKPFSNTHHENII